MWNGLAPHPHVYIFGGDMLGARSSRPTHTSPPNPGFQCHESFWLQKPVGIEVVEEDARALCSSSWGAHIWTYLLRLTHSELQHWGGRLKGISCIQEETEVSGIGASRGHCPFAEPIPHRASRLVLYLRLHHPN